MPNDQARQEIFTIHTSQMSITKFNFEKIIKMMDGFSGAEIQAAATEAGYFAIRNDRTKVKEEDFYAAIAKIKTDSYEKEQEYKNMFG